MKITFVGVGEACDERFPNTSMLVDGPDFFGKPKTLLFDCGFSVPFEFWKYVADPDQLDVIYITHFHGDHFMGVPLLLLRLWEMKRGKPLLIIGQEGVDGKVKDAFELAYPGFLKKVNFDLIFEEIGEGRTYDFASFRWMFAQTEHSQRNYSVRLETPTGVLFYSGDGRPTSETIALAGGSDVLIHEAFHIEPVVSGHGTVCGVLDMAQRAEVKSVALVHIQRDIRKSSFDRIQRELQPIEHCSVFVPEPGEEITL